MNKLQLLTVDRPWGWFQVIYHSPDYWTKLINVKPGESLSLQYHEHRAEFWTPLTPGLRGVINGSIIDLEVGVRYDVMHRVLHRVTNASDFEAQFIEVATGHPTEDDIVRIQDNYGRE